MLEVKHQGPNVAGGEFNPADDRDLFVEPIEPASQTNARISCCRAESIETELQLYLTTLFSRVEPIEPVPVESNKPRGRSISILLASWCAESIETV